LADAQARLTRQALGAVPSGSRALTETWLRQQGERFDRVKRTLEEVADERSLTIARLSVVAGQLAELATL
jgi:NAD-specific glutamate dehydrogenase